MTGTVAVYADQDDDGVIASSDVSVDALTNGLGDSGNMRKITEDGQTTLRYN